MADEKSEHSDTPTGTSPLQWNEDGGGGTSGLSDSTDTEEMSKRWDDFTRLVKSWFPEREDGGLAIPEVEAAGQQFPAPQNIPVQTVVDGSFPELDGLYSEEEWLQFTQLDDEVVPVAGGSGPAQLSNNPTGMFHNREANQHSLIAHQVQEYTNWNDTENPSFYPFMSESSQDCSTVDFFQTLSPTSDPFQSSVCTAPIAPQEQTDDSLPSLSENVDFLQILSQTSVPLQPPVQTARPASHLANETPPAPMSQDQARLGSRASGLAQASNASAGPFLKRYATQPRPTSAREVRGRIDLSVSSSAQSTPSPIAYPTQTTPFPPVTETADFIPSLTGYVDLSQTLSPTNAPPPSPAQTGRPGSRLATATRPLRISPDSNSTRSASEPKCPYAG